MPFLPMLAMAEKALLMGFTANYQSACTWDTCSLLVMGEMLSVLNERALTMAREEFLDEIHIRILRVTEDLRVIQRELNCAAMEAPGDPELMELLSQMPELESLEVLKSALDQMRHFLWFYMQVMTDGSEDGDQLRDSIRQNVSEDLIVSPRVTAAQKFKQLSETALLRYLADAKSRKPN